MIREISNVELTDEELEESNARKEKEMTVTKKLIKPCLLLTEQALIENRYSISGHVYHSITILFFTIIISFKKDTWDDIQSQLSRVALFR